MPSLHTAHVESGQPDGCSRLRLSLNHRLDYGSSTSTWSSCSKDTPGFDELVDGRTRFVAEVCVILNLLALPLLTLLACSADPLPPPGSIPHASSPPRARCTPSQYTSQYSLKGRLER
jgi:hypothetical protein